MASIKQHPTEAQRVVLEEIRAFIAEHGFAPTTPELAERLDVSKQNINQHLRQLHDKGIIRWDRTPRALVILERP